MAYDANQTALLNLHPNLRAYLESLGQSGGGGKLESYPYTLQTTTESQKAWRIPLATFDKDKDTVMVYHNSGYLSNDMWNISGDVSNGFFINIPDNPIVAIVDNNVDVLILKNVPQGIGEQLLGSIIKDGTVAFEKLTQETQDMIRNAGAVKTVNGEVPDELGNVQITVPQIEIVNDLTTGGATKVASAETVKVLKAELDSVVTAPPYGIERINDNHAIRRFPIYNEWTSDVYYEALMLRFPDVPFVGEVRLRMSAGDATNSSGGAEAIFNVNRPVAGSATIKYSNMVISGSDEFFKYFRMPQSVGSNSTYEFTPYMTTIKRDKKIPLYIEVEFLTSVGVAGDILDGVFLTLVSYTAPYTGALDVPVLTKANNAAIFGSSSINFYVNPTTGNDVTGVANDNTKKFKTIQACVDKIPNVLNGNINIVLDAGTYTNTVNLHGFSGSGTISIRSANGDFAGSTNYQTDAFSIRGCAVQVMLLGIQFSTGAGTAGVFASRCSSLLIQNCRCTTPTANYAVSIDTSVAYVNSCDISNRSHVLMADTMSVAVITGITGTGNTVGLLSAKGSTIVKIGTQASATTAESVVTGGQIRT